jgi:hypothetical protein
MRPHTPRGPVDSGVLELFHNRLRTNPLVERTADTRTDDTQTALIVHLDVDRYPPIVSSVTLEIQWYENDEYNFHYCERHDNETIWQCRWDRHPNPAYAHFHRPPNGDTSDVINDPVSSIYPADMLARTLANIDDRITSLWE